MFPSDVPHARVDAPVGPRALDERRLLKTGAVTRRDIDVAVALWRYRYLTTTQLWRIFWPTAGVIRPRRRLARLADRGVVERLRPPHPDGGGSFDYVYRLGPVGFRAAVAAGALEPDAPFRAGRRWPDPPALEHRLSVNEIALGVLARCPPPGRWWWLGDLEARLAPWPAGLEVSDVALAPGEALTGLHWRRCEAVRPDCALLLAPPEWEPVAFLAELVALRDARRRAAKLRRYELLLAAWWRTTWHADRLGQAPYVLWVFDDLDELRTTIALADRTLRGELRTRRPDDNPLAGDCYRHPGRERILFALEDDLRYGRLVALRLRRPARGRRWGVDPVTLPASAPLDERDPEVLGLVDRADAPREPQPLAA